MRAPPDTRVLDRYGISSYQLGHSKP